MRALRNELKYDALFPDASRLTTLVGNHDTRRFLSFEGATLEGAMLHTAFMLTVRGTPQLYSGEEIAMEGKDDPDNRRDFPGGFPGDERNAFSTVGRTKNQQRMWQWTHDWIALREEHPAIRHGKLIDLFYDDDAYAYARQDKSETVIVALNRSSDGRRIKIPVVSIGTRDGAQLLPLYPATGGTSVARGEAVLIVPPRTAVAYMVK